MLYICATPIGNLDDISLRALEILTKADIILCEDTRNSQKLLNHHGINQKRLIALHDHNENEISQKVLEWLNQELLIVQISDAGTPGISDPGARLCNVLHANQITPHPLPGACAYISLLSVSGLVDTPSLFHGFLPNKSSQRQKQLNLWLGVEYAVAIYESPHRIVDSLSDIVQCLGTTREIVMGRELTKHFETIKKLPAGELLDFVKSDSNQQRGEFVLIILPQLKIKNTEEQLTAEQISALNIIAAELPSKKAVNLTNKLFGGNKDLLYQYLLDLKAD
ncbi:MAG: 16S rRNA (cytidine(1402)-2'-O)-methyltransferase [Burkholderiales bacterium]|nr:16S rRNA (cytidine(1402)-2'-O)-methyltransferase [Burkholderiales bacterium]